ncbi:MAG: polysaccharide biosynthesis tyrosine autokinase [Thermodesulfobacteriota bacterium]
MQHPVGPPADPRFLASVPGAYRDWADVHVDVPHAAAQEPRDSQLRDFLSVLALRWRLVAGFTLAALLLGLVACLVIKPLYTSTAVLKVDIQPPQVTTNIQEVVAPPTYLEGVEFFQGQVEVLQSRSLAASTIQHLGLENEGLLTGKSEEPGLLDRLRWRLGGAFAALRRWVRGDEQRVAPAPRAVADEDADRAVPSGLIGKYLSWLEVTPITNTRLIRLSFTTPDPALSERLANGHVQRYIELSLRSKFELTGEARRFLEDEIRRVEQNLARAETALNDFRRANNLVSLDDRENSAVDQLTEISRRLTEARAARIAAEADHSIIEGRALDSLPAVISNPLIQSLKTEVSRLETRHAELSELFLGGSPQMREINSQLKQARSRLEREIKRTVEGIQSVYLAAQQREQALAEEFARRQSAMLDLKQVSGRYIKLEQDVIAGRELYATLLKRLNETDVVRGVRLSNASLVDPAEMPDGPSHPPVLFVLGFSGMFGLGLAVALAFVQSNLDTSLRTPEDVRQNLRLPTLGVVPNFESLPERHVNQRIVLIGAGGVSGNHPRANRSVVNVLRRRPVPVEAYRSIRTSLLFAKPTAPMQTILVTSSQPGEGKTATAVNLAMSLCELGNRVILIDADLRRPRCHGELGLPPAQGLTEVLRGHAQVADVVQRIDIGRMETPDGVARGDGRALIHLLQSGSRVVDSSALLASRVMSDLLDQLSSDYDLVLIDSPPVFPITDASILASRVDGVVVVVHGQRTGRQVTREALERLRFVGAHVVGVVLNGIDPRSTEYHRYSYYFASEEVA